MAGNHHLIQKVTFEIGLPSQEGAYQLQHRISEAFKSTLLKAVEPLFDRYAGGDVTLSIDRLELDLGNIREDMLEETLLEEFQRQISGFLAQAQEEIKNAEMQSSAHSPRLNVRVNHQQKNGPVSSVQITKSDAEITLLDKLWHLLRYGSFPAIADTYAHTPMSVIMDEILTTQSAAFVSRMQKTVDSDVILQRLVLNLSPGQLQYIASLFGCPFSGELQHIVAAITRFMRLNPSLDTRKVLPRGIYFAQPEQITWWYILRQYQRLMRGVASAYADSPTFVMEQPAGLIGTWIVDSILAGRSREPQARTTVFSDDVHKKLDAIAKGLLKDQSEKTLARNLKLFTAAILAPENASRVTGSIAPVARTADILTPLHAPAEEEHISSETNVHYINNAGLIICAPYLHHFFLRCGLLDKAVFSSTEAAWKAVHLLQHLCGQWPEQTTELEQNWNESGLLFNKILCGIPIHEVVPESMVLTDSDREEAEALLNSIRTHWTIMRNSSVHALQSTFLRKQGKLSPQGNNWEVLIERDSAVEILIDKLPWSISLVKLPWTDYMIYTQW